MHRDKEPKKDTTVGVAEANKEKNAGNRQGSTNPIIPPGPPVLPANPIPMETR